jgi:hypothetical protein
VPDHARGQPPTRTNDERPGGGDCRTGAERIGPIARDDALSTSASVVVRKSNGEAPVDTSGRTRPFSTFNLHKTLDSTRGEPRAIERGHDSFHFYYRRTFQAFKHPGVDLLVPYPTFRGYSFLSFFGRLYVVFQLAPTKISGFGCMPASSIITRQSRPGQQDRLASS